MNKKTQKSRSSIISGHVVDNETRPVGKVKIFLKGKLVGESRADGFFAVRLTKPGSRVPITFAAEGHVSNTKMFNSKANGINTIVVWPIAYRVKFDSSRELDVELGSSRVRIPPNALTGASGRVQLNFTLFDITSPLHRAAAPGDFTGKFEDGSIRRLNSYGIFDLDLRDLKAGRLNLRPGAAIDLAISIPPRLIRRAPKRVGYFTFDTLTGIWIHAGSFTWVPSTLTYNGTTTSLGGAHNLDEPQDTTCVRVQVISFYDGSGLPNMLVDAQGPNYFSNGTTDANGFVCLIVDRNASFSVTAQGTPYGGGGFWGNPQPVTLMSQNIQSDATNCGDPCLCPFVGTVTAAPTVGSGGALFVSRR
jgi:hypothetical protein